MGGTRGQARLHGVIWSWVNQPVEPWLRFLGLTRTTIRCGKGYDKAGWNVTTSGWIYGCERVRFCILGYPLSLARLASSYRSSRIICSNCLGRGRRNPEEFASPQRHAGRLNWYTIQEKRRASRVDNFSTQKSPSSMRVCVLYSYFETKVDFTTFSHGAFPSRLFILFLLPFFSLLCFPYLASCTFAFGHSDFCGVVALHYFLLQLHYSPLQ